MRFVKHQSKQQLQTCSGCAEGLESVSKGISFAIIKLFVKFFDEIMVFDAGGALIASFLKVDAWNPTVFGFLCLPSLTIFSYFCRFLSK